MDKYNKRKDVMDKMLLETKEMLYAEDRTNRKNQVDKLLELLRDEYDF